MDIDKIKSIGIVIWCSIVLIIFAGLFFAAWVDSFKVWIRLRKEKTK